jgi:xanthine/uracil permease
MDFVGTMYGLWYYTGKPIPTMPAYLPWDFSLIPVMVMFFIQYKPTSSPFIKALIFATVSSFIAEPLFKWIGIYVITNWKILYSFPIYFLIYLIAHKVSRVNKFVEL